MLKYYRRILIGIGWLGVMPSICSSQENVCKTANTPPSSLTCAFGVKPFALLPLTSGVPYVAATEGSQTPRQTGLYPNVFNAMPRAHHAGGTAIAASLQPLDAGGKVDLVNGKIAAIAEGMSNTAYEMDAFIQQFLTNNPAVNPKFSFKNLSEPNCDLICWVDKGVGAIDPQVQIVLMKHSNNRPQLANGAPQTPASPFTTAASKRFPGHAQVTQSMLKSRLLNLKKKYPNLKLLYLASRSFGGWTCTPAGNSYREPVAFEEGFSVKWLIESQILGADPDLNFSGAAAKAPWLAWGPYLWDSSWPQEWFQNDGAHPCAPGLAVVAQKWYNFLMTDTTARSWFRDNLAPSSPASLSAMPVNSKQINLAWNVATDNSGTVGKYKIYRDGVFLNAAPQTTYSNAGLNPASRYCYQVSAVDSAGNESALSQQVCATTLATGMAENESIPQEYKLWQNHPNPFNPETEIRFQQPGASQVIIRVYNVFGEEIRTLVDAAHPPGEHRVRWDGKDQQGNAVASGVYLYRLWTKRFSEVKRMALIR